MKREPKILPDWVTVSDIWVLPDKVLEQYVFWHREDDEMLKVVKDELVYRTERARKRIGELEKKAKWSVKELRPLNPRTEFSDDSYPEDEFE